MIIFKPISATRSCNPLTNDQSVQIVEIDHKSHNGDKAKLIDTYNHELTHVASNLYLSVGQEEMMEIGIMNISHHSFQIRKNNMKILSVFLGLSLFFLMQESSFARCERKPVLELSKLSPKILEGEVIDSNRRTGFISFISSLFSEEDIKTHEFKLLVHASYGISKKSGKISFKYPLIRKKDGSSMFEDGERIAIFILNVEGNMATVDSRPCKPLYFDLKAKKDKQEYSELLKLLKPI